jgi:hypothetical protein
MKFLLITSICVLFFGCKKEEFQKVDAQSIAEEEIKSINLREVDQFPLFKSCDETANPTQQKACFEKEIHQWLKPHLDRLNYDIEKADTLQLYLSINREGELILDSLESKLKVKQQFDSIFMNPPNFYPAQKRGVPVKVSFELPLILKVN